MRALCVGFAGGVPAAGVSSDNGSEEPRVIKSALGSVGRYP